MDEKPRNLHTKYVELVSDIREEVAGIKANQTIILKTLDALATLMHNQAKTEQQVHTCEDDRKDMWNEINVIRDKITEVKVSAAKNKTLIEHVLGAPGLIFAGISAIISAIALFFNLK